jgi:N-acetyl sugar amidotransferase
MKDKMAICQRCIMDGTAKGFVLNADAYCNYCTSFLKRHAKLKMKKNSLESFVAQLKHKNKKKPYDCIVGVSGGVDSSWVLYLAKKHGLRPLAVHMDNGWNSELATNNINNLVKALDVDLVTHVIEWKEYRELMNAFFKANVIDIELLYDNSMYGVNYFTARKFGIKTLLSGSNSSTEGMFMPKNWNWLKIDSKNIRAINSHFSSHNKIKTMPLYSMWDFMLDKHIRGIHWDPFLDKTDYEKNEAISILQTEMGYKPYPYKHYESIFTRFYQGYILPQKFGVDKRKLHLSTLICTGQISRDEAMRDLEKIPYSSEQELQDDIKYFLKKMKWKQEDLDEYLKKPEVPHDNYPSILSYWKIYNLGIRIVTKLFSRS